MSNVDYESEVAALQAKIALLREALRPFAEAVAQFDEITENGVLMTTLYPSDFFDDREACVWEAARVYRATRPWMT